MRPLTIADVRIEGSRVIAAPAWSVDDRGNPLPAPWEALRAEAGKPIRPDYNAWGGPKPCAICGTPFYGSAVTVVACSDRCARERRAATRTRGERKPVEHQPKGCDQCGQPFTPARSDARYCSGRCRVAAHRVHARGSGI